MPDEDSQDDESKCISLARNAHSPPMWVSRPAVSSSIHRRHRSRWRKGDSRCFALSFVEGLLNGCWLVGVLLLEYNWGGPPSTATLVCAPAVTVA